MDRLQFETRHDVADEDPVPMAGDEDLRPLRAQRRDLPDDVQPGARAEGDPLVPEGEDDRPRPRLERRDGRIPRHRPARGAVDERDV